MDFTEQIRDNRRALVYGLLRRIEAWLEPFAEDLQGFLCQIFDPRLPTDWRERWHAFVAESAAKGFVVQPQSIVELETWIEAWAKRRRLLPEPVPAGLPQLRTANSELDPPGESEPDNDSDDVPHDEPIDQELDADFLWQNFQRPGTGKKTKSPEQLFNDKLAEAQRCLDEIKQVLDALGNKLDAAKVGENTEVEDEADAVEALIFRYNDAIESARDHWLRDDLAGNLNARLLGILNPRSFGLPAFVDDAQAERARKQERAISQRLGERNVTMDRIVFAAQTVEWAGTVAGIALGGGVVLKAAQSGGKWAVIKTVAISAAAMVGEQAVERGLRAVGVSEEVIGGFRLAAVVVAFFILHRKNASASSEPPANAAPATNPLPSPGAPPPPPAAGKVTAPTNPSAIGRPAPRGPLKNPSGNLDDAARAARTQPHGLNPAHSPGDRSPAKPPAGSQKSNTPAQPESSTKGSTVQSPARQTQAATPRGPDADMQAFYEAIDNNTIDRGVWNLGPATRGDALHARFGQDLPRSFSGVDKFNNGVVTSIKSMDIHARSYRNPAAIDRVGRAYVD
jgi:hypothetical protein